MKYKALIILFAISIIFPVHLFAGAFQVMPVKIHYNAKKKSEIINVTNSGNEPLTVQLEIFEWTHNEKGEDTFTPTTDIVFFPKMVTIEPSGTKIIRIGYNGRLIVEKEKTYRLFIRELPVSKPGESKLTFVLNISIPVFLAPVKEEYKSSIEKVELSNDKLNVHVKNNGNTTIQVGKTVITGFDEANVETFSIDVSGWYVLPGLSRIFPFDIARDKCLKTKNIKVSAEINTSNGAPVGARQEKELMVESNLCPKEKPPAKEKEEVKKEEIKK